MAVQDSLAWVSAICLLLGIWFAPAVFLENTGLNSHTPGSRKVARSRSHDIGCGGALTDGWVVSEVLELVKVVAGAVGATAGPDCIKDLFGGATRLRSTLAFGKKQVRFIVRKSPRNELMFADMEYDSVVPLVCAVLSRLTAGFSNSHQTEAPLLRSTTMKAVASVSLESFRRRRLLGMRHSSNVPSKCSQTSGHPVCLES